MSNPEYRAYHSLLAVIHRDGGQHTHRVGVAQSIYDAAAICHEWKVMPERIAQLEAEVARLTAENEADKELASLVRAMPFGATLVRNADDWYASQIGPHGGHWRRETPTVALLAAGVGQEEEPDENA